jgi:signal transduction histidine kinase/CheY-like chemotaxis protein
MSCILAIDDRPINLQFLASLLTYGGHTVLEAGDGEEALGILRDARPDLVITDIKMPRMDGYEFVHRLRQDSVMASIPVIFYTSSYNEREARGMAETQGVIEVITKPSEPEVILTKVNAALSLIGPPGALQARSRYVTEKRDLESLQKTGLKLSALVELGMEIGSERDPEKLLSRFCSTARHIIGARKSVLGVLTEDGNDLKLSLINGLKGGSPVIYERPPVHHSLLETMVRDKRAIRINDGDPRLHLEQLSPYHSPIRSFLGAPLTSGPNVYGWLLLLEKQNEEDFDEDDERMAITLASAAAIAYENAAFAEQLQLNAAEMDRTRREQLELKDQFISHVSHELRSPLAALHQFTTIMLDGLAGEINDQQREYLDIILRNALQLRDMIGDLLDVTRGETGKLSVQPRAIWLCEVFKTLIQTYQMRAAEKGLSFPTTCPGCPANLPLVYADPDRLNQILSNLLDNALKFTPAGEISLRCDEADEAGFVRISVTDTGCGIDAESLPQIFDRLYQSAPCEQSSRKGLGLGLHITKLLVELHGGRIWAESKPGAGTTVFFTVPVAAREERVKEFPAIQQGEEEGYEPSNATR